MQPNSFKESRIASLEMLFHFFKALPSNYYVEKEKKLTDSTVQVFKNETQTFKKTLDKSTCGFDYIEITGMYLCAFDQKTLRAILQLLQKQEEQLFDATVANSLNNEYISASNKVYAHQAQVNIRDFYTLLNNKSSNRSNSDMFKKVASSLQRLATTTLSFYTKDKRKMLTAPLLVFYKNDSVLTFQLHPCIMTYAFTSKNSESNLLKYKQPFYLIDNRNYFTNRSDLEQLIYTKIQYKFASMNNKYKQFEIELNSLRDELFLPSNSNRTIYNQTSKLKKALIQLNNNNSDYLIELSPSSKNTTITILKK